MILTESQKELVVNAGELSLSTETLAYQIKVDENELKKEFRDPRSEVSKHYKIGQELHLSDVYLAIKTQALKGDPKAAEMVIKLKKEHAYQQTNRNLFGD